MDTSPRRRLAIAAGVAPFALFLLVYLALPRHGFMIDDFAWAVTSRVRSLRDAMGLFTHANGFYRPLVALSFAVDEWTFGRNEYWYGVTNVALAAACAWAIAALARALGLGRGAAICSSALWLLNFHGIRTAVLWISGRTELMVVLCLTMSARGVVRGRRTASLIWLMAALLSKEEAILFPVVLLAWILILRRSGRQDTAAPATWTIGSAAILAVYFFARQAAHAMTPSTAPSYYLFVFTLTSVWRRVYIYADEVATLVVLITLGAWVVLGAARAPVDRSTRTLIALGTVWLLGGYGLTIFVPSRSDLYACLPSVGLCIAAAAICDRLWQHATPHRRSVALVMVIAACIALSPVYYLRTVSRSRVIDLAATALADIETLVSPLPAGSAVVVYDDAPARSRNAPNLEDAFGSMLNEAYEFDTGRTLHFDIELPPDAAAGQSPGPDAAARHLQLSAGHVRALDGP